VWTEIPVSDNFSPLIGNHYFLPDCNVTIIYYCLNFLEQNLNARQHRVIMLDAFNAPNYDSINGAPLPNIYYCNKIKENSIHVAICFLGLEQLNNSIVNSTVLSDSSDCNASISSSPVVTPDKYYPPLLLDFSLTLACHRTPLTPHRSYAQGDCLFLCNT
jgi:hypothetical protein